MCFHFAAIKIMFKVWFGFQTVLRAERLRVGVGGAESGLVITFKCAKNDLNLGDVRKLCVR